MKSHPPLLSHALAAASPPPPVLFHISPFIPFLRGASRERAAEEAFPVNAPVGLIGELALGKSTYMFLRTKNVQFSELLKKVQENIAT